VVFVYLRLKELREDTDLSQKTVAITLHCSQQTYSNYELGRRDIPPAMLVQLAQFYHTSVDYLLGLTNVRNPYPKE
jgi:transcriptional regulator with XRE-family HTH domain